MSQDREIGTIADVALLLGRSRFLVQDLVDQNKVEYFRDARGAVIIYLDTLPRREDLDK